MKKLLLLFLFVALSFNCFSQEKKAGVIKVKKADAFSLAGAWMGCDSVKCITIDFRKSGECKIIEKDGEAGAYKSAFQNSIGCRWEMPDKQQLHLYNISGALMGEPAFLAEEKLKIEIISGNAIVIHFPKRAIRFQRGFTDK